MKRWIDEEVDRVRVVERVKVRIRARKSKVNRGENVRRHRWYLLYATWHASHRLINTQQIDNSNIIQIETMSKSIKTRSFISSHLHNIHIKIRSDYNPVYSKCMMISSIILSY